MSIGSDLKKFGRLMTGSPSDVDAERLAELETIVAHGLDSFVKVGLALAEIRDQQLYRKTHATFAEYLEIRWSMKARRAYQLIAAASAAGNVQHVAQITPNARQAEELAKLPADEQPAAWSEAIAATNGNPTAGAVAEIVSKKQPGRRVTKKAPKPIRFRVPGGIVIVERKKATTDSAALLREALDQLQRQAAA